MRRCCIGILVLLACAVAHGADERAVSRILRSVDFEERRLGNPEELPMHWTKVQGTGLPHYVNGRLATDRARSGAYSFRFDLNGGSLIYRYEPGRIKIRPLSHYRVSTWVQTTALRHARARLTAYFADALKRPVMASVTHSELYTAATEDAPWKELHVELSPDSNAESLVIELELLQPELYTGTTLGQQSLFPQDIQGTAWFDDVTVAQVPKVKMSTDRPGNIFRQGETMSLEVLVNDRTTDDLAAQLLITNADGKTVYQRSGALDMAAGEMLAAGLKRMRLRLPPLPAGWYEASLVMTSGGQFVGRQQLHLVLLADRAPFQKPDDRFGIIATDLPFDGWAELPELLPFLSAGHVKLAVWSRYGDVQQVDPAGFDKLLLRLKELNITPMACLLAPPPEIAAKLNGDSWLGLLKARPEDWQPQLAYLVSRHANHLDRWQIGEDGSDIFVTQGPMRQVYRMIHNEFAKLVQTPDLAMPWPSWYELSDRPATLALSVHPSVLPPQLPLYIQEAGKSGGRLALTLQLLDRQKYGRDLQVRDLAQRVIYALAADARRIDVPLPFTVRREDGALIKEPQELFIVLRTLLTTLSGTTYRGKVPIGEGVDAFLFDKNGQGILALWDRGHQAGVRQLALTLGENPRALDLWGNSTPLLRMLENGKPGQQVQLTVGPMPFFLIDVDGQLAQLRASVAFDRPLIESDFQPHRRRIRFTNPYRTTLGGTLRLKGPQGWSITPAALPFNVNPGETFDREVVIEFPYNSFAGAKTVEAEFQLPDSRISSTVVPITMNLGLSDVGMQTLAIRDGKDVLVEQIVTNYGERPIDYTAFAVLPGHARQERIVNGLGPGRTTIKLYRFTNVAAGRTTLRTGVKEMAGTRILNDEVEVQ